MLLLKLLGYVYIYTNNIYNKMDEQNQQLHNFMKENDEKELHSETSE